MVPEGPSARTLRQSTFVSTRSFKLRASPPKNKPGTLKTLSNSVIPIWLWLPLSFVLVATAVVAESVERGPRPSLGGEVGPRILGPPVTRGTFEYRYWASGQSLVGLSVPTPVLIVSGAQPGPTVCLTGAVHGDELNGVEIIRRVLFGLDPTQTNGTVVGVPIVNLHGFRRSSRYLPDRRDLNRFFPGDARGSSAARLAQSLFSEIVRHCSYLVDIHTGSFHRTNLAQIRADLGDASILKLARMFGDIAVLNNPGTVGTLRRAAMEAGIAAVTMEIGEPLRLQPEQVEVGANGILDLLAGLGVTVRDEVKPKVQPVYYQSTWSRADDGGILLAEVGLGETVSVGQLLGTVTDPITNERKSIVSPVEGRVIGMAINQVVMPGFAAFHLGHLTGSVGVAQAAKSLATGRGGRQPSRGAVGDLSSLTPIPGVDEDVSDDLVVPETEMEPDDHRE